MVRARTYITYLKDPQLNTTAWAFQRSNTEPSRPVGGSYASPLPSSGGWTAQIPSGEEKVWVTTRIFTSDGLAPQDPEWSIPRALSDTSDFDMVFSGEQSPANPSGHPNINIQWGAVSDTNTRWMAVSRKRNGAWTAWQVFKVKGNDGTSLTPKGSFLYYFETTAAAATAAGNGSWVRGKYALTVQNGHPVVGLNNGTVTYTTAQENDAYLKDDTGEFFVAKSDGWTNVGVIRGPSGNNAYVHIKFATSTTRDSWTTNNGEDPGAYIGIYADHNAADALDWDLYKWAPFKGQDGFGYEYIYKLTSSAAAPAVPGTSTNYDGYLPEGWSANPVSTTDNAKYCWQCYRKKENGVWGSWRGSDANTAVLWSKYGDKGDAAVEYVLVPNMDSLGFHSNGNGAAFTPASYTLRCRYNKIVGGSVTLYDCPSNALIGSNNLVVRFIKADGTPDATFGGEQPEGWDWVNGTNGYKDGNCNFIIPSSTTYIAVEFAISTVGPRSTQETTIIARTKVPFWKFSDGDRGNRGPRPRGPQAWSDCSVGYSFLQGAEGEQYYDVVLYEGHYYSCEKTHVKTANNFPGSDDSEAQGLWVLALEHDFVASKILLATYALVKNLGVECIDMRDANDNILFQAKDGAVSCKTGTFENIQVIDALAKRLRNPFTEIDNSFSALDDDTMYTKYLGSHTVVTLGWDAKQSGRRICVLGSATFQAPANNSQHYFLDGKSVQSFQTSYEIVELMGWGTSNSFKGWVVTNRTFFRTNRNQGRALNTVAYGIVQCTRVGSNYEVGFVRKKIGLSGNGDISVTRQDVGLYNLYVPKDWFYSADYIHCNVCGRGMIVGGSAAVFANVYSISTETYNNVQCYKIQIATADDATRNDGGFYFELKNLGAWDD